ncbi:hypothetical protein [Roseofilum sp. Guam]|nr:hypothetical protein [Roseofilum sp. Guam]
MPTTADFLQASEWFAIAQRFIFTIDEKHKPAPIGRLTEERSLF